MPPELHFHPDYGWYTIRKGVAMTHEEKVERLKGYPYYSESALEGLMLRARSNHLGPPSADETAAIEAKIETTIEAMAKAMTEGQLAFVRSLILHAEQSAEKRIAGVLLGMKPKARQEWIERHAS